MYEPQPNRLGPGLSNGYGSLSASGDPYACQQCSQWDFTESSSSPGYAHHEMSLAKKTQDSAYEMITERICPKLVNRLVLPSANPYDSNSQPKGLPKLDSHMTKSPEPCHAQMLPGIESVLDREVVP
ncbi:hypothetical protein Leryth_001548 [Lithospermum erythrorhizon]|nr:hypothetical protein Leryth_001548 [Lithospermum erythrorhizon]